MTSYLVQKQAQYDEYDKCVANIRRKKKYAEARASMSKQNEDSVNVLIGELAACYNQYGSGVVSSLYSNPRILAKIRQIIASGNAYTVNDAVNLMHQYSGNSAAQLQAAMPIQPVSFFTADSFK